MPVTLAHQDPLDQQALPETWVPPGLLDRQAKMALKVRRGHVAETALMAHQVGQESVDALAHGGQMEKLVLMDCLERTVLWDLAVPTVPWGLQVSVDLLEPMANLEPKVPRDQ